MTTRLSGLLANRPAANAAVGARFYATNVEQVYFSTGTQWLPKNELGSGEENGLISGANLAARPDPNDSIGYVWTDAATGNQYEAFPGAWALINGPSSIPTWFKYSATFQQFKDASEDPLTDLDVYLPLVDLPLFGGNDYGRGDPRN